MKSPGTPKNGAERGMTGAEPSWIDRYYCIAVAWTSMEFEWDAAKERANIAKHGLDFQTASRVFLDPLLLAVEDDRDYDEL
jgi:hypothetical protein